MQASLLCPSGLCESASLARQELLEWILRNERLRALRAGERAGIEPSAAMPAAGLAGGNLTYGVQVA